MNAPSRYDLFVLAEGEPKLTIAEDTKIPDAATFTINKEDHTLANMLRAQLLTLPYVIFSGYKVPHPLEPVVVLKVQTDGTATPVQAVQSALAALVVTLAAVKTQFNGEVLKAKAREDGDYTDMGMEDGGMEGQGQDYYGANDDYNNLG